MRYALIAVIGASYYLGWLPASLCVPALLVILALRMPATAGRTPRRGGFIHPPAPVSSTANQTTAERVATYTSSPVNRGDWPEVRTALTRPPATSRITAHGFSGNGTDGSPGRPGTDAEPRLVRVETTPLGEYLESRTATFWVDTSGDCGCGDTAA